MDANIARMKLVDASVAIFEAKSTAEKNAAKSNYWKIFRQAAKNDLVGVLAWQDPTDAILENIDNAEIVEEMMADFQKMIDIVVDENCNIAKQWMEEYDEIKQMM